MQARPAGAHVRDLGSIGFGYPAAIGAWSATGEPVLCVTGYGGFGQFMGELLTAVKHDMNITHILLNNGQLGKISEEQQGGRWTSGRPRCTTPTSVSTRASAARSGSA